MTTPTPPPPAGPAGPRHAADDEPGRRPRALTGRAVLLPLLGLTAALALGVPALRAVGDDNGSGGGCAGDPRVLRVAAAPEIAPVLEAAVADRTGPQAQNPCVQVRVQAADPAEVSAALTAGGRAGVDAWVPDSTLWLERVDVQPAARLTSLALSPVVLAVTEADAQRLGWPDRAPDVARALTGDGPGPLRLSLIDPRSSAAAGLALAEVTALLSEQPDGRTRTARVLRAAEREGVASAAELSEPGRAGTASPSSEQAVRTEADRRGRAAVVAWYPPGGSALDYPLATLTDDPAVAADLQALVQTVTSDSWAERVRAAGFRAGDGTAAPAGPAVGSAVDTRPRAGLGVPDRAAVERSVQVFEALGRGIRMLAVLDVSGSMAEQVPGSRVTRMDAAAAAAANGLGLLADDTQVGLWVFATGLTPTADHRELVPVGPLGAREDGTLGRETLARALSDVQYIPDGDTGLYDTVLAATRSMRASLDPERVSSVVVITDGRNDDAEGIELPELLETLRQEGRDRPVPVIGIAYGPDGDLASLQEIAAVTGGSTYHAQDPRRIGEVLEDALAQRSCRPAC